MALKSLTLIKPINSLLAGPVESSDATVVHRFGLTFSNPVGLAAGFDKDGLALQELSALGFGHVEAGTVTYHAQPGNPRPRLFRLPKDQALINRAGFNNDGAAAFVARVRTHRPTCVLGVSIGKSKITPFENAVEDYLASFNLVYEIADYVAVNVSSPNTPQLRQLQQAEQLTPLLSALQKRNLELKQQYQRPVPLPLLVKLSPDLSANEIIAIVDVVKEQKIDGIIATNTTVDRGHLRTTEKEVIGFGDGGLSGKPLQARSTEIIARLYQLTDGQTPIIGVGGIFTAEDAWEKIAAGASLVQLYTGFIYQGPRIANDITRGLAQILKREGFEHLDQAVGHKAKAYLQE